MTIKQIEELKFNNTKLIAGPCAVENPEMIIKIAKSLSKLGVKILRGGVSKYRSDPHAYQGIETGIGWLMSAREKYGLKICVEIMSMFDDAVGLVEGGDILQIGARNMHNTELLKNINTISAVRDGKGEKPNKKTILYKKHYAASLTEFVKHAEYLSDCDVILCLRGSLSIHPHEQRFCHDFADIARLREMTDKKICYDVSHSSCDVKYVRRAIDAALAYEPDYLMVEVHNDPKTALSDSHQQLILKEFEEIAEKYKKEQ